MRSRFAVLAFAALLAWTSPTNVSAQEADVQRSVSEMLSAWESGDFAAFAAFYHEDTRGFFLDGGVLLQGFNVDALTAAYTMGMRAQMAVRDLDVKVYGDVAVSVAYLDGTLTMPGGMEIAGTWRYTDTRVNDGGAWSIVQYHFSEQQPVQGR